MGGTADSYYYLHIFFHFGPVYRKVKAIWSDQCDQCDRSHLNCDNEGYLNRQDPQNFSLEIREVANFVM